MVEQVLIRGPGMSDSGQPGITRSVSRWAFWTIGGGCMAKRRVDQLTSATVASLIRGPKAGRHGDGHGLYLVVEPNGAARWVFLFRWRLSRAVAGPGRLREMGLGSSQAVSLKRARQKA